MRVVPTFGAPTVPPLTSANFTPSAPTWICSLPFLTVKPPLFRVLLPTLRPPVVSMPTVTFFLAASVLTVMPLSPAKVSSVLFLPSVILLLLLLSLPPLMVSVLMAELLLELPPVPLALLISWAKAFRLSLMSLALRRALSSSTLKVVV